MFYVFPLLPVLLLDLPDLLPVLLLQHPQDLAVSKLIVSAIVHRRLLLHLVACQHAEDSQLRRLALRVDLRRVLVELFLLMLFDLGRNRL